MRQQKEGQEMNPRPQVTKWTPKEMQLLREWYQPDPAIVQALATLLKRSPKTIQSKAQRMELSPSGDTRTP